MPSRFATLVEVLELLPLTCLDRRAQSVRIADVRNCRLVGSLLPVPDVSDITEGADSEIKYALDQIEPAFASRFPKSETTLAARSMSVDLDAKHDGWDIQLGLSTYTRFRAAAALVAEMLETERVASMRRCATGTIPALSHSLGVNCTLETVDDRLVWTQRSARNSFGGSLSVAMSESANPLDLIDGTWNPYTTGARGFSQELGIETNSLTMEFHSVVAQVVDGGISVSGHARTSLTYAEVIERHEEAEDAYEAQNLIGTGFSPEAVSGLMTDHPIRDWVGWAAAGIIGLSELRFEGAPIDRVETITGEYPLSSSFVSFNREDSAVHQGDPSACHLPRAVS